MRLHDGGDDAEEGFHGGEAGANNAQFAFEIDPNGGRDDGVCSWELAGTQIRV